MKHPIEEWKALWESGKSFAQIAEQYGVTRNTVAGQKWRFLNHGKDRVYRFSISRKNSGLRWRQELARRLNQYGHLLNTAPAGSTKAKAIAGFLAGKTAYEIGGELGVSQPAIMQHLWSVGIRGTPNLAAKTRASMLQKAT